MTEDHASTEDEFRDLARGTSEQASAFFHFLGERELPETRTRFRVHWLASDQNGNDRTAALARHLYFRITDYCTPRSRIVEAGRLDAREGGNMHLMSLQDEARRLFLSADNSGEGGELLLFFLLEAELQIPQILCKMPLKTSQQMPIHGVDGVHARPLSNGRLAVYWGESKLYADVQGALSDCFKSIAPFLLDDGTGVANRDLVLVRENLDVADRDLALQLVRYFTDDAPERNNLEVRGACLVGFTHPDFGSPYGEETGVILDEVQERVDAWAKGVKTRVGNKEVESIEIEFFCLPLPSVDRLRTEFQKLIGAA